MDRRDFLCFTGAASAAASLAPAAFAASTRPAADAWRVYEVVTEVEVLDPVGETQVWIPAPLTIDTRYHKSLGNAWTAEGGTVDFTTDPRYGAGMVWARFPAGRRPVISYSTRFAACDIAVDLSKPGRMAPESPLLLVKYTQATDLLPIDGVVKDTSAGIVKGRRGTLEKARAIYDWIVDSTERDPQTRGCGTGDVRFMLENRVHAGKCADLNALFVALARAEGIPARDVYGIRVDGSALGYESLGKSGGDITKAQHCRAEFYLEGHGWVPVDPADVRKVILEEDGGKAMDDPMVVAARERLFGSWEMNWLAYNYAHDVRLPGSSRSPIPFLMYPQSETAQGRLDSLDPENFRYRISSRRVA